MYLLNLFCAEQFCWPKSDEVKIFTHVGMSWVSGVLTKQNYVTQKKIVYKYFVQTPLDNHPMYDHNQ